MVDGGDAGGSALAGGGHRRVGGRGEFSARISAWFGFELLLYVITHESRLHTAGLM